MRRRARMLLAAVGVIASATAALPQAAAATHARVEGQWRGTIVVDSTWSGSANRDVEPSAVGTESGTQHATVLLDGGIGAVADRGRSVFFEERATRFADDYSSTQVFTGPGYDQAPPYTDCTYERRYTLGGPVLGGFAYGLGIDPVQRYPDSPGPGTGWFTFGGDLELDGPPSTSTVVSSELADPSCFDGERQPASPSEHLGCLRGENPEVYVTDAQRLVRLQLRREGDRLVPRFVMQGGASETCAGPYTHDTATFAFDLVFYPERRRPPSLAGGLGMSCGIAAFRWHTVAGRRSSVRKGERACAFLLGNDVAKELLSRAVSDGRTLTSVFGEQIRDALVIAFTPDAYEASLRAGLEQSRLRILARYAPKVFRAFRILTWEVRVGEAIALQAVPLSALFAINQIKNKDACVQIIADVDDGGLELDWNLVHAAQSLKHKHTDVAKTRARTYRKVARRLRPDTVAGRTTGLRCGDGGAAEADTSAEAFSRQDTLEIAG